MKKTQKRKKRYLRGWLEKTLIIINTLIFCFICMVNDFNFKGFIILIILLLIFGVNALIINKYGRILKDNE